MTAAAGLQLAGVRKAFGEVEVLRGLDLEVEAGELLVVLGPSGSGKSTTLRIAAGLEEATAGTVRIGDRDVTRVPASKRNVAMVFQSYALFPHLDAGRNIGFGLSARGMKRDEVERRVGSAAALVGVADLLHRKPHELSGGERQGVALARALAREPAVFLLDEPLSNLDAQLRTRTRAELKRLHGELGRTMVYVTHDQVEALTLGDRIAVLERGVVAQVGTPDDIYRRPADRFVASFVGSPAMNFLAPEAAERFGLGMDGEVGVRPEHVRLGEGEVDGEVVIVEPAGSEGLVHVDAAGTRLVARVRPEELPEVGSRVRVAIRPADVHRFGPDGKRQA
jgi:ABC-type sugar transport system ATPase subunit